MPDRVPIGAYGLIGDTRSAALVAPDGSIDWWCVPRFDDPPLFGRLVGGPEAGWFSVGPAETAAVAARAYRPDTATLITTWTVEGGELELADGLVAEVEGRFLPATVLVRRLSARGRAVRARLHFVPRFGYERQGGVGASLGEPVRWCASTGPRHRHHLRRPHDRDRPARRLRGPPRRTGDDRRHRRPPQPADRRPTGRRRRGTGPRRGRLARLGSRNRGHRPSPRRRAQPHHLAAAHLLAVRRAGRRPDHLASRAHRRRPQLGLPLRLATRRLDRHRRLPRRRQAAGGPGLPRLAPPRQPPVATPPAGAVHPRRTARATRDRARRLARLRRQPPRPGRQRRRPPAPARRLRLGARRRLAPHRRRPRRSTARPGGSSPAWPTRSPPPGPNPTPGSGSGGPHPPTTSTPS